MKTLTLIAVLAAGACAPPFAADPTELCPATASLAKIYISARQGGVPLGPMMESVNEVQAGAVVSELARSILLRAYRVPNYSTPAFEREAVIEFTSDVLRECWESFR